jgi:hypothetical protein
MMTMTVPITSRYHPLRMKWRYWNARSYKWRSTWGQAIDLMIVLGLLAWVWWPL